MDNDDAQIARVPDSELYYDENFVYTYKGEPFTGIGYDNDPELGRSELDYVNGLQHGISRDWYPSGRLRGETRYYENSLHGLRREYDEQGVLRLECLYDHDTIVRSVSRDANGQVVESYEIVEGTPEHKLLERSRRESPWPPPEE